MNEGSDQSMQVEPLAYQQVLGANVWPDVIKALALAVLLSGMGMISGGVTTLWVYGLFGPSPLGTGIRLGIESILSIAPTMAIGAGLLFCSIAVLGGVRWGITMMLVMMFAMLILLVGLALLRVAINVIGIAGTSTSSMRIYQAVTAFNYLLAQSVLPLLVLVVLRIFRRSTQPGY